MMCTSGRCVSPSHYGLLMWLWWRQRMVEFDGCCTIALVFTISPIVKPLIVNCLEGQKTWIGAHCLSCPNHSLVLMCVCDLKVCIVIIQRAWVCAWWVRMLSKTLGFTTSSSTSVTNVFVKCVYVVEIALCSCDNIHLFPVCTCE